MKLPVILRVPELVCHLFQAGEATRRGVFKGLSMNQKSKSSVLTHGICSTWPSVKRGSLILCLIWLTKGLNQCTSHHCQRYPKQQRVAANISWFYLLECTLVWCYSPSVITPWLFSWGTSPWWFLVRLPRKFQFKVGHYPSLRARSNCWIYAGDTNLSRASIINGFVRIETDI